MKNVQRKPDSNNNHCPSHARCHRPSHFFLWVLSFFFLSLLSCASVAAFGIAPSREAIPYDPSSPTHTFTVRIINSAQEAGTISLSLSGELAQYATLPVSSFPVTSDQGELPFTYSIALPQGGLPAGENALHVLATLTPENAQGTVTVRTQLVHDLIVRVPYPGVYAEGSLYAQPALIPASSPITFIVGMSNKGSEEFIADGEVIVTEDIWDQEGKHSPKERIKVILPPKTLAPGTSAKIDTQFSPGLPAGSYAMAATVVYKGKRLLLSAPLTVGTFFSRIDSIRVKTFKLGTIAKFDVTLENSWNAPTSAAWATLEILDPGNRSLGTLSSLNVSLPSRGKISTPLYWDTAGNTRGHYTLQATVFSVPPEAIPDRTLRVHPQTFIALVEDSSIQVYTPEEYAASLAKKPLSVLWIILCALGLALIGLLAWLWRRKRNRNNPSSKRRSR